MKTDFPRAFLLCGLVLLAASALLYRLFQIDETPGDSTLTVAEGFEVELVAGPPLVERPISIDFDEQGRLYVTESSGSNDPVEQQLEQKTHRVKRLEDTDGDGRFDRSTPFADGMMIPQGALWFDGSLYVAAPPSIWKLTDTDGDGIADRREEWFAGKTLTGCANDLHGPYLGPDGWIYWTKGAFAEQTYERPDGPPLVTRAAHVFRRRPSDSWIEPVLSGGMDNPVDVVFTPRGERLLASTFVQHPKLGRRDGIIHAVHGSVYGKPHDVLHGHARTGDLLPAMLHLGPAAPCAQAIYASRVFGSEYQGNLFACLFNLNKVTRHVLEPSGATFKTRDSDFLVSGDRDFHPTDVLEDADGSLLVADTGGWYKLCCPTSQLHKPDVLGGIYRIRRKGAPGPADPRGLSIDWDNAGGARLTAFLDDRRPAVRNRAMAALAKTGSPAVEALRRTLATSASVEARRNAVWTLTRIHHEEARAAVRPALSDADESVRQAALHSVSVWRDAGSGPRVLELLEQGSASIRRVAAEALGRIGDRRAVPGLLTRTGSKNDRILEHSLIYALIEIADPDGTAAGLRATSAHTRRAALIALDQMPAGGLTPESVTPLLASGDPILKQTAAWIAGGHPEWGDALARYFRRRLARRHPGSEERAELTRQLARFAENGTIQSLLASTVAGAGSIESRQTALRAMAGSTLKETPSAWVDGFVAVLTRGDQALIREAVSALRSLPNPGDEDAGRLRTALLLAGRDSTLEPELRVNALAAIPGELDELDPDLFEMLQENLGSAAAVNLRTGAAGVLGRSRPNRHQMLELTETVRTAGPLVLSPLLGAYRDGGDEDLGRRLMAAVRNSKGLNGLRADVMKQTLANFPPPVQRQGEQLLASLAMDPVQQKTRLEDLLAALDEGDIRRGQDVFNSSNAACSSCHAIGYQGGRSGPDLTRIGDVRSRRDLLESILFPSASFVRGYEPVVVVTESGEIHQGVVTRDGQEEVRLVTGPDTEVRVARSEIREIRPGNVSVMPSGLEEQVSREELASLLAFLSNARRRPR
ncbi:MAG: HEAT repeat domain-containing protein [Acidobacteriota bacterium]|nr:HEAT repeat domain-containing protein [Acidobacteriota bacterium]